MQREAIEMILMPTMVIDDDAFEWVPESVEQEMG